MECKLKWCVPFWAQVFLVLNPLLSHHLLRGQLNARDPMKDTKDDLTDGKSHSLEEIHINMGIKQE